jgi:predicted DNA-binding transcriptional regulator AlpA
MTVHHLPDRRPPLSALGGMRLKTTTPRHSAGPEPRGLSRQAAAEYVGVGTTLFDAMVKDGRMPRPFRVGARVIWDRRRLDAAFDAISDQEADRNPWDEALAA